VTNDAGVGEIKGWAGFDELGGALLASFLQARDDRYALHGCSSLGGTAVAAWRRRFIALALDSHGGGSHVGQTSGRGPKCSDAMGLVSRTDGVQSQWRPG